MIKLNPWSPTQTSSARISMGGFQIFKVDHWTWNLILADINTFAVPLSTYVIIEIQIKCYKSSYCVIVYVGHFWPPNLCPISVRYWIYTPISMILNPKYFLRLTPFFLCPCTWRARARCTNNGGREGSQGWQFFRCARFIVPTWGPIQGPSTAPSPSGDWGVEIHGSLVFMTSWLQLWSDH